MGYHRFTPAPTGSQPRYFAVLKDLSRSERASTHWCHLTLGPSRDLRRSERPAADLMTDGIVGMRGERGETSLQLALVQYESGHGTIGAAPEDALEEPWSKRGKNRDHLQSIKARRSTARRGEYDKLRQRDVSTRIYGQGLMGATILD